MRFLLVLMVVAALVSAAHASSGGSVTYRIDHVTDGDTVVLRNGQRVRLVQIDSPEKFFGWSATPERRRTQPSGYYRKGRGCDCSSSPLEIVSTTSIDSFATSCGSTA